MKKRLHTAERIILCIIATLLLCCSVAQAATTVSLGKFKVTHYCTCVRCCGNSKGITASGRKAEPYKTIAVDRRVIPLGSTVIVNYGDGTGDHYYRADDTGGAIKGNKIDVCVSGHKEALNLGVRWATVKVVKGGK